VRTLAGLAVGTSAAPTYTVTSAGATTQSGGLSVLSGGVTAAGDSSLTLNNFNFATSDPTNNDLNVFISPNWRFQVPKGSTNNTLTLQYNSNRSGGGTWVQAGSFTA
jgi:hypothetical protein